MPRSDSLGQFEQLVLTSVITLGDNAYGVTIHKKVHELVVSKYSIPLDRSRIEILLDGADGRVSKDDPRATLTQCA